MPKMTELGKDKRVFSNYLSKDFDNSVLRTLTCQISLILCTNTQMGSENVIT